VDLFRQSGTLWRPKWHVRLNIHPVSMLPECIQAG
jgi:hypothetical protein